MIGQIFNAITPTELIHDQKVITIPSHSSITNAIKVFASHGILSAPVVDTQKQSIIGIVSYLDVVSVYILAHRDSSHPLSYFTHDTQIGELMNISGTDPYIPLYSHSNISLVLKVLARGIHRVVIMGGEASEYGIVGTLSQSTVIKHFIQQTNKSSQIKDYLSKKLVNQCFDGFSEDEPKVNPVTTVHSSDTFGSALSLMNRTGYTALPVLDPQSNKLIANISASDLKRLNTKQWDEYYDTPVIDFLKEFSPLSLEPHTVNSDSSMLSLLEQLTIPQSTSILHHVWVLDQNQKVLRAVSLTDLIRWIITEIAQENQIGEDSPNLKYFTQSEVALHNTSNDIWVSLLGRVYDLSPLIKAHTGSPLIQPLLDVAGEDISHWFEPTTGDVMQWIDPKTDTKLYYTPMGRFLDIPEGNSISHDKTPWWKDENCVIGQLAQKTRRIRIVNTLTSQDHTIEVATTETINQILERYKQYNDHAGSYTWKRLGQLLDMKKTLAENGVEDEDEELLMNDEYIPAIYLYFNDDLKYSIDD